LKSNGLNNRGSIYTTRWNVGDRNKFCKLYWNKM